MSSRPQPRWPRDTSAPVHTNARVVAPPPQRPVAVAPPSTLQTQLNVIPRSRWAKASPITSRLEAMNGINRITIHHEGWKNVFFTDIAATAARIEADRNAHVGKRWGDIGYHFIIDRSGRIWEGRPIQYQGAHAGGANNQHNVGVMVLGNFDQQAPTTAQLNALVASVRGLRAHYGVSPNRIYTHQELSPTRCPGTQLQPHVVSMRSQRLFG